MTVVEGGRLRGEAAMADPVGLSARTRVNTGAAKLTKSAVIGPEEARPFQPLRCRQRWRRCDPSRHPPVGGGGARDPGRIGPSWSSKCSFRHP